MLAGLLASSRYITIIAVIGSLLASFFVILFAAWDLIVIVINVLRQDVAGLGVGKQVAVGAIELIELFLLGIVLYVIALGMYQLFIEPNVYVPKWLQIRTIDDLKERLLSTVLVMLAVTFLGFAVTWDGSFNILAMGVAAGLVIAAIAYGIKLARESRSMLADPDQNGNDKNPSIVDQQL